MKFEFLMQQGRCSESLLPWMSGEQALASSGIYLIEYHGIRPWREEGPNKVGWYSRILQAQELPLQRGNQAKMSGWH